MKTKLLHLIILRKNNQSHPHDESVDTENLHTVSTPNYFKDNMVLALTRCDEMKKLTPNRNEGSESVNQGQDLIDFSEPEEKINSSLEEVSRRALVCRAGPRRGLRSVRGRSD